MVLILLDFPQGKVRKAKKKILLLSHSDYTLVRDATSSSFSRSHQSLAFPPLKYHNPDIVIIKFQRIICLSQFLTKTLKEYFSPLTGPYPKCSNYIAVIKGTGSWDNGSNRIFF